MSGKKEPEGMLDRLTTALSSTARMRAEVERLTGHASLAGLAALALVLGCPEDRLDDLWERLKPEAPPASLSAAVEQVRVAMGRLG